MQLATLPMMLHQDPRACDVSLVRVFAESSAGKVVWNRGQDIEFLSGDSY
jgi:hypothetical protein